MCNVTNLAITHTPHSSKYDYQDGSHKSSNIRNHSMCNAMLIVAIRTSWQVPARVITCQTLLRFGANIKQSGGYGVKECDLQQKMSHSLHTATTLYLMSKRYALQFRRIDCEQICSRINQQLIVGRLATKAFVSCIQNCFVCSWRRPSLPKHPAISHWLILIHICSQSIRLQHYTYTREQLLTYDVQYMQYAQHNHTVHQKHELHTNLYTCLSHVAVWVLMYRL